jgi:drug/metabolite transporter (DMT)-like permease
MKPIESPAALLMVTGVLLGLTFPFGKIATNAGISPLVWAFLISAGSGLCLLIICAVQRLTLPMKARYWVYFFCLATVSLAIPNVLIFTVIPKLGAGFTGLLFTLSPIFTLLISALWQVKVPNNLGIAGIALGFVGAAMVAITRGELGQPTSYLWVGVGLCIPLSLAVGNVYRSLAWPGSAQPLVLATGTNVAAGVILLVAIVLHRDVQLPDRLFELKAISLLAVLVRLQKVGGPTYLSQISYIAAAIALVSGTVFLSERYSLLTWMGAVVIVIAILLGVKGQKLQAGPGAC